MPEPGIQQANPELWLNDDLSLHVSVPEAAMNAALERVGPWSSSHEFHYGRLVLFQLDALLLWSEDEPRFALVFGAIGIGINLDPVGPIRGGDLQTHG